MIKKVEAAHRQDNSEGTEHIPDKVRKSRAGMGEGHHNSICRLPGNRVSKKMVG